MSGATTQAATRQEMMLEELTPPFSHYAHAVRFGSLLLVSGLVGLDREGRVVAPDAAGQADRILADLALILDRAGASLADVLKVTVYLTDMADRAQINPVREAHFGAHRPASTLIEIKALVMPELKVEIEAIVGIPGAEHAAAGSSTQ
jgi:enamine deaminase RidA (YjgF/YER057c/UK114 family)